MQPLSPTTHRQIMEGPALTPAARARQLFDAHNAEADMLASMDQVEATLRRDLDGGRYRRWDEDNANGDYYENR